MKMNVEDVWDMECKTFYKYLQHMEAILAEERYILQRQLDNHIKAKHAKTIDSYSDIYKEFSNQMEQIIIKQPKRILTIEEQKELHRKNLVKWGLR